MAIKLTTVKLVEKLFLGCSNSFVLQALQLGAYCFVSYFCR